MEDYPLHVAGVTLERYLAVYHPLDYNRRQQDSTSHGCRLVGEYNINIIRYKYSIYYSQVSYICPLLGLSFLFNISKFLESEVVTFRPPNSNETLLDLDVTELRYLWMHI